MSFVTAIKTCFGKYATFQGRAPRSEFWYFTLFYWIALVAVVMFTGAMAGPATDKGPGAVGGIAILVLILIFLLPHLAVTVRRLHDTDKSGWRIFFGLIPLVGSILLLVWYCSKGTDGANDYGDDPFEDSSQAFA